jgi:CBS-domain-containing membrane protein
LYKFLEETAGNYMTRTVTTVTREMTVRELSDMFERDDFNTYPVQEEAEAVGIVTKFDLLKCFAFTPNQMVPRYADLMNRTVADVMTPDFIYVRPDEIDAGAPAYGRAPYS